MMKKKLDTFVTGLGELVGRLFPKGKRKWWAGNEPRLDTK
jgi:hypothetical protein